MNKAGRMIGVMDRVIYLMKPVVTRDDIGGENITYVEQDQVWAEVRYRTTGMDEREVAGADLPMQQLDIVIRYYQDINPKWQIKYENKLYDIIAVSEEGRGNRMILRVEYRERK
jgi:SPP1 family predicted phage head-tail adaptor